MTGQPLREGEGPLAACPDCGHDVDHTTACPDGCPQCPGEDAVRLLRTGEADLLGDGELVAFLRYAQNEAERRGLAEARATAGAVEGADPDERYLRLSDVTGLLYDHDFDEWERSAAGKGSGVTADDWTGIAIFRGWMKQRVAALDWIVPGRATTPEAPASPPPLDVERLARLLDDALYDTPHWSNPVVERAQFARILASKIMETIR